MLVSSATEIALSLQPSPASDTSAFNRIAMVPVFSPSICENTSSLRVLWRASFTSRNLLCR